MHRETSSRVLDSKDEWVSCRACTMGPPLVVRRYYVRGSLDVTIDLCDACAENFAAAVARAQEIGAG